MPVGDPCCCLESRIFYLGLVCFHKNIKNIRLIEVQLSRHPALLMILYQMSWVWYTCDLESATSWDTEHNTIGFGVTSKLGPFLTHSWPDDSCLTFMCGQVHQCTTMQSGSTTSDIKIFAWCGLGFELPPSCKGHSTITLPVFGNCSYITFKLLTLCL